MSSLTQQIEGTVSVVTDDDPDSPLNQQLIIDLDKRNKAQLETILQKLKNDRYEEDTRFRRILALWTTTVVTLWLGFVVFVLCNTNSFFQFSDTVLSVLLGTTTLNILGLSFIVLKGLFAPPKD